MIYTQAKSGIFEKYWETNLMSKFAELCTSRDIDTDEAKDLINKQLTELNKLLKAIEKMEAE